MASPEREAVAATAIVEDVLRMHGEGLGAGWGVGQVLVMGRNIDMAWRKAEVAGELFSCLGSFPSSLGAYNFFDFVKSYTS